MTADAAKLSASFSLGKRVRTDLGEWGKLEVERPLPFVLVFRRTAPEHPPEAASIVTSEAAWLMERSPAPRGALRAALSPLIELGQERFEGFLIVEVWIGPQTVVRGASPPAFAIVRTRCSPDSVAVDAFRRRLERIKIRNRVATVDVLEPPDRPEGSPALLSPKALKVAGAQHLGLHVSPCFLDARSNRADPLLLAKLRRQLSVAFRWLFHAYAEGRPPQRRAALVHAMGPRRLSKAARDVDAALAEIAGQLTFILQASPINVKAAWRRWKAKGDPGVFRYRPLPYDPYQLKRALHSVPIERVTDPTLHHVFRDVQLEIDRKLTMLIDLGTSRYLQGSLALYGGVEPDVLAEARLLLDVIPARARGTGDRSFVSAEDMAAQAEAEVAYYRAQAEGFSARVELRQDIASDLICSQGHLLIDAGAETNAQRVPALLQHEVGTHLVTYYNGLAQPLRLLSRGLPGAVDTQEGLAVLSEFLVGALQAPRMRVLAARVVAVHQRIQGAELADTVRLLHDEHRLEARTAFNVAVRAFRGGGLTKDAAYFRGLHELLAYLGGGGRLDPLFLGKFDLPQLPLILELRQRGILVEPPFRPRYLDLPEAATRLEWLRQGVTVTDLLRAPCD